MAPDQDVVFRQLRNDDLDRPDVAGFHCGDMPWEDKGADYLRTGKAWQERKNARTFLDCTEQGEGQVVGFATVVKRRVGYLERQGDNRIPCLLIAWLAVATDHQCRGHSKSMLEALVLLAIEANLQALYLFVDERNERALQAYLRRGFEFFANDVSFVDPDDGSRNLAMILPLVDPN